MLCKGKLVNLDFKSKTNNAKHILLPSPSPPFIFIFYFEKQQKQSQNEMHKYYTMQILEKRENKSNKEEWSQRVEQ